MPLKDEQKQRLRKRLQRDYRREKKRVKSLRDNFNRTRTQAIGELSAYDQHPADTASEYYERERDQASLHEANQQLQDIQKALIELGREDYGYCVTCGREIHFSRLLLVPSTIMCRECAERSGRQRNI